MRRLLKPRIPFQLVTDGWVPMSARRVVVQQMRDVARADGRCFGLLDAVRVLARGKTKRMTPLVLSWLVEDRPVRRIHHHGDLYLERWYLFGRPLPWVPEGKERLRWLPSTWVHRFVRPDADRELHNHPWAWALSIIARGSYDEEYRSHPLAEVGSFSDPGEPVVLTRRVRWLNLITRSTLHRVARLHGGPRWNSEASVWTVFIIGRKVGSWGFLRDGEVVPWRDFLRERGEPVEEV